ncbi:Retrovirus-related Pol polyprotein from transposon [Halotydeus destructor]|nr:Retrovirus-related Pol polyprotein from transposon [Halotydeus destructor]
MAKVRSRFFWPSLDKDVREYVKSCVPCQFNNQVKQRKTGLLKPLVVDRYWDTVHIDIAGPFFMTFRRNQYVLIAIDHASKWVEGIACRETTSEVVARFLLKHIYLRHGAVRNLVSDRGTQFMSQFTQSFLKLMKTKSCPSTAWHPQTNGQVENYNKTVVKNIKKFCNERKGEWDEYLDFAIFSHNTSKQMSTGESPYKLLYKEDPNLPIDIELGLEALPEYLVNIRSQFQNLKDLADHNAAKARDRQKKAYDARHADVRYQLGQQVLIVLPSTGPMKPTKLNPNAFGPFEIIEVLSPLNYRVRDLRTSSERIPDRTEHVSRLKPYYTRDTAELSFTVEEETQAPEFSETCRYNDLVYEINPDQTMVTLESPEAVANASPDSSDVGSDLGNPNDSSIDPDQQAVSDIHDLSENNDYEWLLEPLDEVQQGQDYELSFVPLSEETQPSNSQTTVPIENPPNLTVQEIPSQQLDLASLAEPTPRTIRDRRPFIYYQHDPSRK